jgi:hypothetical protein
MWLFVSCIIVGSLSLIIESGYTICWPNLHALSWVFSSLPKVAILYVGPHLHTLCLCVGSFGLCIQFAVVSGHTICWPSVIASCWLAGHIPIESGHSICWPILHPMLLCVRSFDCCVQFAIESGYTICWPSLVVL